MSKKTAMLSVRAEDRIVLFQENAIRRVWRENEWWFSVVDVCAVLTESADAGAYWRKLKQRLGMEGSEVVTFCHGLKLEAPDGKQRVTDCANTEGIFRIIQSIPSPKAEPFKRWLALEAKTGAPVVSRKNYLNLPETISAKIAVAAFIETQTEALAPAQEDKSTTRKRVAKKTAETISNIQGKKKTRGKNK